MNRSSVQKRTRRDELLARCQHERYELVAAAATAKATFPRTRRMAHWVRAMSRLLRAVATSMRAS